VKRFKLEWLDLPGREPSWFDTREELDAHVRFIKSCPVDDGPVRLRVTEFSPAKVELL